MKKVMIVLIILMLIATATILCYYKLNKSDDTVEEATPEEVYVEPEKVKIYTGHDRPIAVVIDNEEGAWPHSGLQDAYMIYEMIIEGGETRMVALFKNKTTEKIGPIRSARHYFIQYAMEHSAIFAHFGWSPKAQTFISQYNVNNINGLYDDYYWRVGYGYHNAFSSIAKIKEFATKKKYLDSGYDEPIYKYDPYEIQLEGKQITNLNIDYSYMHDVQYEYNEENQVFYRSMRGKEDKDRETGEIYYAKNIIVMYVTNYNLPDVETKGRQELENVGEGTGYYITNGKYIDIKWKKESDKTRTVWYDLEGNEIVLNDGITYVQLVPSKNKVKFTEKVVPVE